MNKSLRALGPESSRKRFYGFQAGGVKACGDVPKKRAAVSGGF
jgi:hypothetical protein